MDVPKSKIRYLLIFVFVLGFVIDSIFVFGGGKRLFWIFGNFCFITLPLGYYLLLKMLSFVDIEDEAEIMIFKRFIFPFFSAFWSFFILLFTLSFRSHVVSDISGMDDMIRFLCFVFLSIIGFFIGSFISMSIEDGYVEDESRFYRMQTWVLRQFLSKYCVYGGVVLTVFVLITIVFAYVPWGVFVSLTNFFYGGRPPGLSVDNFVLIVFMAFVPGCVLGLMVKLVRFWFLRKFKDGSSGSEENTAKEYILKYRDKFGKGSLKKALSDYGISEENIEEYIKKYY